MKAKLLCLLACLCLASPVLAEDATEKDYSYLEDMTVKELKDLRNAINELLGDEEKTEDNKGTSVTLENIFGDPNEEEAESLPDTDLEYQGWTYHFVDFEKVSNRQTGEIDIVVYFDCTNNSKKASSVHMAIQAKAYQNGIGLKAPSFADSSDCLKWDANTYGESFGPEIQPGNTIRTGFRFQLDSQASDVTFELLNWGFSVPRLRRIISIM